MKTLTLLTVLMLAAAGQAVAQKQKSTPDESGKKEKASKQTDTTAPDRVLLEAGSSLEAALTSTIDVRRSKVGDEVILKTTKAVKAQGQTVVPKGTNLIGRITEVKRKSGDNKASAIAMVFERIEGRALSAPLSATITSVTNVAAAGSAGSSGDDLFGSVAGSGSASGSTRTSGSAGGGLLGGVGSTVGGVLNTATQTTGSVVGTTTQTAGSATGTLGGTLNGLRITQSANGSANGSTTLSTMGKDLRLEKGVTFNLLLDSAVVRQ